jgi:hypothetical protein
MAAKKSTKKGAMKRGAFKKGATTKAKTKTTRSSPKVARKTAKSIDYAARGKKAAATRKANAKKNAKLAE